MCVGPFDLILAAQTSVLRVLTHKVQSLTSSLMLVVGIGGSMAVIGALVHCMCVLTGLVNVKTDPSICTCCRRVVLSLVRMRTRMWLILRTLGELRPQVVTNRGREPKVLVV